MILQCSLLPRRAISRPIFNRMRKQPLHFFGALLGRLVSDDLLLRFKNLRDPGFPIRQKTGADARRLEESNIARRTSRQTDVTIKSNFGVAQSLKHLQTEHSLTNMRSKFRRRRKNRHVLPAHGLPENWNGLRSTPSATPRPLSPESPNQSPCLSQVFALSERDNGSLRLKINRRSLQEIFRTFSAGLMIPLGSQDLANKGEVDLRLLAEINPFQNPRIEGVRDELERVCPFFERTLQARGCR